MESVERRWYDDPQRDAVAEEEIAEVESVKEEKIYVASYAKLMWWRFLRHRLAVVSAVVVVLLYGVAAFAEFLPEETFAGYKLAPPTRIHFIDNEGRLRRPFVYLTERERDPKTLRTTYVEDRTTMYPIRFFVKGPEYQMWGRWTMDRHLFGIDADREEQGVFLLGADRLGRDLFSRMAYGARISLTIGLVSIAISLVLGIVLGGISGYYGGMNWCGRSRRSR